MCRVCDVSDPERRPVDSTGGGGWRHGADGGKGGEGGESGTGDGGANTRLATKAADMLHYTCTNE